MIYIKQFDCVNEKSKQLFNQFEEEFKSYGDGFIRFDDTVSSYRDLYYRVRDKVDKFFKDGYDAMLALGAKPYSSPTLDDYNIQLDQKVHYFDGVEKDDDNGIPCLYFVISDNFTVNTAENENISINKGRVKDYALHLIANIFASEICHLPMRIGRFNLTLLESIIPQYDLSFDGYIVKVPFMITEVCIPIIEKD